MTGVARRMAREREPGGEHHRDHEGGPEQHGPVGQPREEHERAHQHEPQRHRDESDPEAHLRERREVAVEEVPERQLESVLGAEQEGDDPDLDRADRAEPCEPVEAPLRGRRQRPSRDQQAEAEAPCDERQREEVEPAHHVLGRPRPGGSEGLGRRRRAVPDPEREDARDRVAVGRGHPPADGVAAARELLQRHGHDPGIGVRLRLARDDAALARVDGDRVRQRLDRLVEAEQHPAGRGHDPLRERRLRLDERRVRPGRGRGDERQRGHRQESPLHRCCAPASGERWPKIGAVSRSL